MNIIQSDLAIEDYIARDNPARAVSIVDELIDLGFECSLIVLQELNYRVRDLL